MSQTVLILGASGRFGRNAALAFAEAGWAVRPYRRGSGALTDAATGAQVIVNGWNPPYTEWESTVPGLTEQVIAAARNAGATVILPGNVYVYGPDAPENLTPDTPHAATNPLGQVRIRMEAAYRASGVQTIVLRGGDFLDIEASGNWFDRVLVKSVAKGTFVYPGRLDAAHAWAFLPDMARAAVSLAEMRTTLAPFEDIPFPGYTLTGQQLADAVGQALGRKLRIKPFPWWQLRLAQPFMPMAKPLREMRYLWDMPHRLDRARLETLLPGFQSTALATAIRAALQL